MTSPRRLRRCLFALTLVSIPFPYMLVEVGHVPAIWLAGVATLVTTSAVVQGGETSARVSRWLLAEGGAVLLVAYLLARLLAWVIRRTVPAARQGRLLAGLAVLALGTALLIPIFRDPAIHGGAPVTLLGMFGL